MIPLELILLRRRSDVPGTGANHLVGLILLDAMTNPTNRSSQGEESYCATWWQMQRTPKRDESDNLLFSCYNVDNDSIGELSSVSGYLCSISTGQLIRTSGCRRGIAEAMGGLRHLTGYPDRPPTRLGVSLGDSLAGI